MANKPLLHDLLKQDQEPFHLKSHIAGKRSELKSSRSLQLRKREPIINEIPKIPTNLCKHACFYSFQTSPDVRRSPFPDIPSPAKSPSKSPNSAVFLHIPSRTATLLVEAAMRIQKQNKPKPKNVSGSGSGLIGSFLKRLKDRSKNRKRAIENSGIVRPSDSEEFLERDRVEEIGLSGGDWAENRGDYRPLDFEASTSNRVSESSDFENFCSSPFRFSLDKGGAFSSGRRTPEFCSPAAASPSRRVKQENPNCESRDFDKVRGEEEEKEQCSPVSVLDPPFDEEGERSDNAEEDDDFDMECSYENVQRAKQQLLLRLRRFEKLAELDPVELEMKLLEGSEDENHAETEEPKVETIVSQVFNQSSLRYHSRSASADMKRLVCDLFVEEKGRTAHSGANEVVMGRICNRIDSWREVEFDTIDMMIGLDFKKEFESWTSFGEQVQESAAEIELGIFVLLVEELTEDLVDHRIGSNLMWDQC